MSRHRSRLRSECRDNRSRDVTGLSEKPSAEDLVSKLRRDPAGNLLAILLLVGMLAVFLFAILRTVQAWPDLSQGLTPDSPGGWQDWAVAGLCLVGLGVSIYMAFVETTHTTAVCGPVGDCNTVQQSEYALLFGRLPVGVLGVLGYAAMLVVWVGRRWGRGSLQPSLGTALFAMASVRNPVFDTTLPSWSRSSSVQPACGV